MASEPIEVSVSELVALLNQTLEYAYPAVVVVGELANVRVSKGKWLYFDLKDGESSVKCFGTVFMLPGPLEDGMLVRITAAPRLHKLYGFSMQVRSIQPSGEGSLRKAAALLQAKLTAEGLFDVARKRPLPYPPRSVVVVTSEQSAAYADFVKILQARWGGVAVSLIDVQVQGEPAPRQITAAIEYVNAQAQLPDVLVLIRGGGSPDDLAAFNTEQVTRAVAASRAPTLVAIGHEIDTSLAELAADMRGSTPSNAAELLVPDRQSVLAALAQTRQQLLQAALNGPARQREIIDRYKVALSQSLQHYMTQVTAQLQSRHNLLAALNPLAVLERGYAVVQDASGLPITQASQAATQSRLTLKFADGSINVVPKPATITGNDQQKSL